MRIPPVNDVVFPSSSPTLICAYFPLQISHRSREIVDLSPRGNAECFAIVVAKLGLRPFEGGAGPQKLALILQVFGRSLRLEQMTICDINPQPHQLRSAF